MLATVPRRLAKFTPRADEIFRIDAQAIRDPGDIVEIGYDLGGVVNRYIVESVRSKVIHVNCRDTSLLSR